MIDNMDSVFINELKNAINGIVGYGFVWSIGVDGLSSDGFEGAEFNFDYMDGNVSDVGEVLKYNDSDPFSITGVFKSIPAILFAFDSFLIIGNVQKNVENPEKNVPLSIIISMIIAAVFQILITIGCITIGTGNPYELLRVALDTGGYANCHWAYVLCVCILSVSITIATLGVLNSYSMAGTRATQVLVDEQTIYGYKWASKLGNGNDNLGGFAIYSIFIIISCH